MTAPELPSVADLRDKVLAPPDATDSERVAILLAAWEELGREKDSLADALEAAERQRDELQDRLDYLLPPLTPNFAGLMARLEDDAAQVDQLPRGRVLEIIHEARHLARFGSDSESGQRVLISRLEAAERRIAKLGAVAEAWALFRQRWPEHTPSSAPWVQAFDAGCDALDALTEASEVSDGEID